jgi:hypothetical protein
MVSTTSHHESDLFSMIKVAGWYANFSVAHISGASESDQDIGGWDVSTVINMNHMVRMT